MRNFLGAGYFGSEQQIFFTYPDLDYCYPDHYGDRYAIGGFGLDLYGQ